LLVLRYLRTLLLTLLCPLISVFLLSTSPFRLLCFSNKPSSAPHVLQNTFVHRAYRFRVGNDSEREYGKPMSWNTYYGLCTTSWNCHASRAM
jgi:hypothetical protein